MTCTVTHTITAAGGRTVAKGSRPVRPVRWDVSVWLVYPSGMKNTHAITVDGVTLDDLVPAVATRVDELIAETGAEVTSGGWIAHGRGGTRKKKRRK